MSYQGTAWHEILHICLRDYIPFIILLAAGTIIASWVGTTGASMLMIRPVLRMNRSREKKAHIIIFFIFLVSNMGGALTPLGDPPLLLGFLHGVPFFWTLRLIPEMIVVCLITLVAFYIFDRRVYRRELAALLKAIAEGQAPAVLAHPGPDGLERIRVRGLFNLLLLAGVVGAVLGSGLVRWGEFQLLGVELEVQNGTRDLILVLLGLLSLKWTPIQIRNSNAFTWGPIQEVAILFAGIFMTIVPMLAMLRAGTSGAMAFIIGAVREPWHYFWASGGLSSFLDNAPTYLTFLNTALGQFYHGWPELQAVHALIAENPIYLKAISCGAVFMGANTYIGNAPNFMVKSIAEENGIPMPSFFGYMLYSILILIPSFVLVTFLFFRP